MGEIRASRRLCMLLLVGLTSLAIGCNRQDRECLKRLGHRAATLTGGLKESLSNSLQGVCTAGLENRVAARLRWDKSLAEVAIEVKAKGGEIELAGTVADRAQRQRALELAESTTGVEKVSDQLQVADGK